MNLAACNVVAGVFLCPDNTSRHHAKSCGIIPHNSRTTPRIPHNSRKSKAGLKSSF